ncbi:phosphatidylinositol 4-kinase gamma 1-like [Neltuma alba]|uniref:phosphatidylinositol 4-kinase gamma 1-like n=1 Tax=Neltuma alba TaxID=207710 RepID=UPI0010A2B619|nr:phosphatidylinositol 4-kinase gamma 1-like [Prosopis alba]
MRLFEMAVAIDQHHGFKPFSRSYECMLQPCGPHDHNILELSQTSHTFKPAFEADNIHRSSSTPCLSLTTSTEEELGSYPRIAMVGGRGAPSHALVVEVAIAMASGVCPQPLSKGLGGAYVFCSQNGDRIAVAKPADEEPLALNNPKGLGGRMLGQPGLKGSIRVGESGIRELAAYLLDYESFAGVPPSAFVKFCNAPFFVNGAAEVPPTHCKIASLHRFVDHEFDAGELGPSFYSIASVHRIGILDIRLLNLDRHAGNMLVKRNSHKGNGVAELVPIDHGLCLPEWMDDPYFEWLHWPQASIPFSDSELEYISKLDPFRDAELLRTELPLLRESSIRVLLVCTIFLKQAATAGLCLADIGQMMTREFRGGEEKPSEVENICSRVMSSIPYVCNNGRRKEETENESKMFQFDNEIQDGSIEGLGLPQLLQTHHGASQVPKTRRLSFAGSMNGFAVLPPLNDKNGNPTTNIYTGKTKENTESHTEESRDRSSNFSSWSQNFESGGLSFARLNLTEWELFLEIFEKLLPAVFEAKKRKK